MNRRLYSLISLMIAALLGTGLFLISEHVQRAEKELAQIKEKVAIENDSLRILNAEWAYLNRPDRLEQLSVNYLQLQPASAEKMTATIETLPTIFIPARPGIKPANIPPEFIALNHLVSTAKDTANIPKTATPLPAKTPGFNQLIDRLADKESTP